MKVAKHRLFLEDKLFQSELQLGRRFIFLKNNDPKHRRHQGECSGNSEDKADFSGDFSFIVAL